MPGGDARLVCLWRGLRGPIARELAYLATAISSTLMNALINICAHERTVADTVEGVGRTGPLCGNGAAWREAVLRRQTDFG